MILEEIPLSKIHYYESIRQDMGDIKSLAKSIETIGLLNPITVKISGNQYSILAGRRRFLACKYLKQKQISARILDKVEWLEDYNIIKPDFTRACILCDYPMTDEHHILPKFFNGADVKANKIFVCPNHHRIFDFLTRILILKTYKKDWKNYMKKERNAKKYLGFQKNLETYDPKSYEYFLDYIEPMLKNAIKLVKNDQTKTIRDIINEKTT